MDILISSLLWRRVGLKVLVLISQWLKMVFFMEEEELMMVMLFFPQLLLLRFYSKRVWKDLV
jgi:hypothetical protein